MPVPQVAIVGRPNVGKSSLFNWLARRRLAIVDDFEGVTRDRMTTLIEHNDRYFELIDTGGMGVEDDDDLTADVRRQIEVAINSADVILLVVDVQTGPDAAGRGSRRATAGVERPVIWSPTKRTNPPWTCTPTSSNARARSADLGQHAQNRNREDCWTDRRSLARAR
jgi:GTPase